MSEIGADASPLDIAPMSAAELEDALPLFAGYQRFYGVAEPDDERNRRFFARFLAPSEAGLLLRARTDGAMTGFACLYFTMSSINAADVVLLSDLFVAPEGRGRGIGYALIEASLDVARSRGAWHLEWVTAIDNRTAQRVYERFDAERSAWFGYEIPTGSG